MKQYVVGGAVRDALLGRDPKDLDFVWVGATPEQMEAKGFSRVGADFPVFLDDDGNEHALARKERKVAAGYTGFEVEFDPTVTLEDDLARRDLTINAMAIPFENWEEYKDSMMLTALPQPFIIDYFGGYDDLRSGMLRHVSDAFSEDPVRVLRVARFAARYGYDISLSTIALMIQLVEDGELDALVPERVWSETERALGEPNPMAFFRTLKACRADKVLFPELPMDGFLESSLLDSPPESFLRFGLMCLRLEENEVNSLCERLKVPNDFRQLALRSNKFCNLLRDEVTAEDVVAIMESCGAFQSNDLLAESEVAFYSAFNSELFKRNHVIVYNLIDPVRELRFADLTTEQQQILKGPDVGAALRELRVKKTNDLL
jgi:tRNA nucleotidyltransferase (CCA-adding enzyme)